LPLHETHLQQPETGKSGLECCLHPPPNTDNGIGGTEKSGEFTPGDKREEKEAAAEQPAKCDVIDNGKRPKP